MLFEGEGPEGHVSTFNIKKKSEKYATKTWKFSLPLHVLVPIYRKNFLVTTLSSGEIYSSEIASWYIFPVPIFVVVYRSETDQFVLKSNNDEMASSGLGLIILVFIPFQCSLIFFWYLLDSSGSEPVCLTLTRHSEMLKDDCFTGTLSSKQPTIDFLCPYFTQETS